MGKKQHSKDLLHIRPTEWVQDHGGFKAKKRSPFANLPLHCCALSLQPFKCPVGTREGYVFEAVSVLNYLKKYKVNPVTGKKLEPEELVPLHFHRNDEGLIHCPVTYKVFTDHSVVVVNIRSGHVYSQDAVDQLNRKTRNWKDLITSEPLKSSDIITLQNPDDVEAREIASFHYIQKGQQDEVVNDMVAHAEKESHESKAIKIRTDPALKRIFDERQVRLESKLSEAKAKEEAETTAKDIADSTKPKKIHDVYTSGEVAESFTSTSTPLRINNVLRPITEEEHEMELYEMVRKNKAKGYVRMVTTEGMLNIELHCNIVPRTTDNFLRLCERNYYDDTMFHRLIHNFVVQGGDPTNTGHGGKSGFPGGRAFKDEFDSRLNHQGPGIVSMANNGKDTNKSQFFISLKSCPHLDLKHSIFGRVVGGLNIVAALNSWETDDKDKPIKPIKIIRTEVFKNPFKEAAIEAAKAPAPAKVIDPSAMWFSSRGDPMQNHKNRHSAAVGKYMDLTSTRPSTAAGQLPAEEMEYASVTQKSKRLRTAFDFANW